MKLLATGMEVVVVVMVRQKGAWRLGGMLSWEHAVTLG